MLRRDIIDGVGWTWGHIGGLRHCFFINCAIGIVRVALQLAFVWISKHIIDIATQKAEGSISHWVIGLVVLILAQLVMYLVFLRYREHNRLDISNKLRADIFRKVMNSRWTGQEKLHTGDTVTRLEEDIKTLCAAINEHIPQIVVMTFQLVCASIFLFTMQKSLLWVLLVIMPIALLVSKIYYKKLRRLNDDIRRSDSGIQSHLQENILKRILILSMIRLDDCLQRLDSLQGSLRAVSVDRINLSSRASFFVSLGFMSGYCVTFCWGAFGIVAGTVTYGMMTAFLQLVSQVQNPIVSMSRQLPQLMQAITSVDRLRELDSLPQEDGNHPHYLDGAVGIRISNLSFTYPGNGKPTISNLSYDFRPGVSTAIVGQTGSGKSTLMRILLGILRQQDGRVHIYNHAETLEMQPSLRCNFQYVPQGNSLISGTVRDNLLLGKADATDAEMMEALRTACADFATSRPDGLDMRCGEQGAGLSEGQAQRIAIARALLQEGKIMLMDEACSAIDNDTESRILQNLKLHCKGRTIIWITHHDAVRQSMAECLML